MIGLTVDVHTHLYGPRLAPPYWIEAMAQYGSSISSRTPAQVEERMEREWFDETGDLLVQDMDTAQVDKSVVFAMDFGLYCGIDDGISLTERYRIFSAAVQRHPGRLVMFAGVDPRRPDARTLIQRAVHEFGAKGVKIWPPSGFNPSAAYCYRVYEKCAELALPVVIHTGQEIGPLGSEGSRPIYCDQPASDFPELNFILAHSGMAWWREAAEIAWHHPNVYLDTAYWQAKYLRSQEMFARELRELISIAGKHKVLFGTDWPALRSVEAVRPGAWTEALKRLPKDQPGGIGFTADEIELLMGGNACRLLGLQG